MHFFLRAAALAVPALAAPYFSSPTHLPRFKVVPDRAQAVVDAFNFAFDAYWEICRSHDELNPVRNRCEDSRNGFGATSVDALSTAVVMRQTVAVNHILDHIAKIDWGRANGEVSVFETTVRYLGGMLSAYDLLNGPYKDLVNKDHLEVLLAQSIRLVEHLKGAFSTETGIPHPIVNIAGDTTTKDDSWATTLAEIGSLVLEWQRLSDITGQSEWGGLAFKAEAFVLDPRPPSMVPWPGMPGEVINITSGDTFDIQTGWTAGSDSAYEYMLKMYLYDSDKYPSYLEHWLLAADSTIRYLTSHPPKQPNTTFLASYAYRAKDNLILVSHHLTCFAGGNFILGGLVTKNQTLTDFGLALTHSCHHLYASMPSGLAPEAFGWEDDRLPDDQKDFFTQHGFYTIDASYNLRADTIESYYYAYRATGNTTYQDWAWDIFRTINSTMRTHTGFSAVEDVRAADGGGKLDKQGSYVFAELFKYLYLIHANDTELQVNHDGLNHYVLNTGAHPFKVHGKPV